MPALPSGTIIMWAGAIGTIPGGFVLCDGTLGTPDLRDRFVVGAGNTYSVNDTGGSTQHNHTFTGDGHFHTLLGGTSIQAGAGYLPQSNSQPTTGTTNNTNHLPLYFALAFIMKT